MAVARAAALGKWGAKRVAAACKAARNWPCLRSNCAVVITPNEPPLQGKYNCSTRTTLSGSQANGEKTCRSLLFSGVLPSEFSGVKGTGQVAVVLS